MSELRQLIQIDWWYIIIALCLLLVCVKFIWTLLDWLLFEKLGIETKKMKQRREDSELLRATAELAKTTAENLDKLQKKHCKDEEEFRNNLNTYIEESRKDRKALHDEMTKFTENRQNDRAQSLKIQKELSDSIKAIADRQDDRDKKINDLKDLFVDKQISDYRWEIINLADKISDGKRVSKEALRHAISTHSKYEDIIEEYGLTNGEVNISMEIINEELKRRLSENLK